MSIGQLLLLSGYLALTIGLVFGGSQRDIDWFAHHSAMLCFAQLPLIIGLAGKNNAISFVTGVPYESLNLLHRWSARLIVILSSIHVGGRIYVNVPNSNPSPSRPGYGYIRWGWVGYVAFILLIFAATRQLRNFHYTTFKVAHITLVAVAMISMLVHRPERYGWVLAGILLWALDRIARVSRVIFNHLIKTVQDRPDHPRAWVEALSSDTIRLTITTTQTWLPGNHAYVTAPGIGKIASHPFSIASIMRPLDQLDDAPPYSADQVFIIRVREGFTKKLYDAAIGQRSPVPGGRPKRADSLPPATERALQLERTRTSDTRVELDPDTEAGIVHKYPWAAIRATTEGAYGRSKALGAEYQTILLISGGSGVAYALPIMRDVVRRARAMSLGKTTCEPVVTQRCVFVMVVRSPEHLEWIRQDLEDAMAHAPPGLLHVKIYCSRKENIPDDLLYVEGEHDVGPQRFVVADHLGGKKSTSPPEKESEPPVIRFHAGRPRVDELLEAEIEGSAPTDWVAVGVCGPTSLGQAVQESTYRAIRPAAVLRGERRRNVHLELEQFGW